MLPPKIRELKETMDAVRAETLGIVGQLSEGEFAAKGPGGWSVADTLEHMLLVETSTSKVIRKVIREKGPVLPPYPADDAGRGAREAGFFHGEKREAPEIVRPKGSYTKEEALKAAAECRRATHASLDMLASVDPWAAEFPHPSFPSLNLFEWPAIVVLEHERMHQAQIREILAALQA